MTPRKGKKPSTGKARKKADGLKRLATKGKVLQRVRENVDELVQGLADLVFTLFERHADANRAFRSALPFDARIELVKLMEDVKRARARHSHASEELLRAWVQDVEKKPKRTEEEEL